MWKTILTIFVSILSLVLKRMLSGKKRAKSSYRKLRNGYEARRNARINRVALRKSVDKLVRKEKHNDKN